MHQLREANKPKIPDFVIGKRYQVNGYHTGNFVGECIEFGKTFAVFRVSVRNTLSLGEQIEVQFSAVKGGTVKITEV